MEVFVLVGGVRLYYSTQREGEQELNASFQVQGLDLGLPVSFLLIVYT